MAVLAPEAVNQDDLFDPPEDRLCEISYVGETGPVGERHMRRDLHRSRSGDAHRAARRMQIGGDLAEVPTCLVRRHDKGRIARAAVITHQPIKTERERRGPQGSDGLSGALDENRVQIVHVSDRVDGQVERIAAKGLSGPQITPCLRHAGVDLGRGNGGEEHRMG